MACLSLEVLLKSSLAVRWVGWKLRLDRPALKYTIKSQNYMDVKISPQWKEWIGEEFEKPYFAELVQFVKQEYATQYFSCL